MSGISYSAEARSRSLKNMQQWVEEPLMVTKGYRCSNVQVTASLSLAFSAFSARRNLADIFLTVRLDSTLPRW